MIAPNMAQIAMEMEAAHVCSSKALNVQVGSQFSLI